MPSNCLGLFSSVSSLLPVFPRLINCNTLGLLSIDRIGLTMTRTVKVAIVGSGLSGLTAAYLLSKTEPTSNVEFEIHLFEKACASLTSEEKLG